MTKIQLLEKRIKNQRARLKQLEKLEEDRVRSASGRGKLWMERALTLGKENKKLKEKLNDC